MWRAPPPSTTAATAGVRAAPAPTPGTAVRSARDEIRPEHRRIVVPLVEREPGHGPAVRLGRRQPLRQQGRLPEPGRRRHEHERRLSHGLSRSLRLGRAHQTAPPPRDVELGLEQRACHDHLPEGPGSPAPPGLTHGTSGLATRMVSAGTAGVDPLSPSARPMREEPGAQAVQAPHEHVHHARDRDVVQDDCARALVGSSARTALSARLRTIRVGRTANQIIRASWCFDGGRGRKERRRSTRNHHTGHQVM